MIKIYRQRYMPNELLWLENDEIIKQNDDIIITKWTSIKPRPDFDHGVSCYFLHKNYKISKFYDCKNNFLYYYCDVVKPKKTDDGYVFCDLLADVILYPDKTLKVLDLDELASAYEQGFIASSDITLALNTTDALLRLIYSGEFEQVVKILDNGGGVEYD